MPFANLEIAMLRRAVSTMSRVVARETDMEVYLTVSREDLAKLGLILAACIGVRDAATAPGKKLLLLIRVPTSDETCGEQIARLVQLVPALFPRSVVCEFSNLAHGLIANLRMPTSEADAASVTKEIRCLAEAAGAWGSQELARQRMSDYRHRLKTWLAFNQQYAAAVLEDPGPETYKLFRHAFHDKKKWPEAWAVGLETRNQLVLLGCLRADLSPFEIVLEQFEQLNRLVFQEGWPHKSSEQQGLRSRVQKACVFFEILLAPTRVIGQT